MNQQIIDRAEAVVETADLAKLYESVANIAGDLAEDGFPLEDAVAFILSKVKQVSKTAFASEGYFEPED